MPEEPSDDSLNGSGISNIIINEERTTFWDFDYFGKVLFLFVVKVLKKIVETALSVKVWILFLTFFYSRELLMEKYINGDNFAAIVGSVMGVIIAMRSLSKISMMIGEKIRPTQPTQQIQPQIIIQQQPIQQQPPANPPTGQ